MRTRQLLERLVDACAPEFQDIVELFQTRDADLEMVCATANDLRRTACGDEVTYVVNRNINYTNICLYRCSFCAFSKGSTADTLRGKPYDIDDAEVMRRTLEAADRGATEVCLQGGIHPSYTGDKYLSLCRAIKTATGGMHIHAFSPLEIAHGAATLGTSPRAFLQELKAAGLGSLPGTAAEILVDRVRDAICPDKLRTSEWLDVVAAAHDAGLYTTATIMFGHVDSLSDWADHLLHIRELQARTGGVTEFVPLPFVHAATPMGLKGLARHGPTFREVRLMHAIARIVLYPHVRNIQASWVKLGAKGAQICLDSGANDLGGTLMNESISRAAGSQHGQEMPPEAMEALIRAAGRTPVQRTTLYGRVSAAQHALGFAASPLAPVSQTPPSSKRARASAYTGAT